jgi:ribosomal protein L24E
MIEKISNAFDKAYLYIYTNDNEDNTLTLLEKFKEKNNNKFSDITIENETGIIYLHRGDLTILVYGRNKCLEYARKKKVNYMAMIDLDNVLNYCEKSIFNEMVELLEKENVVAVSKACTRNDFYDKFSYRTEKFNICIQK